METQQPKKKLSTGKKLLIGIGALLLLIGISQAGKNAKAENTTATNPTTEEPKEKQIQQGEILHTEYFDITIKQAYTDKKLETGNQFTDKTASKGQTFLVLESVFMNTDKESRIITDGKLILIKDDKEYAMEKSETIMVEGWGIMLNNINPLTSLHTNLVYQIPDDFKGTVLYEPARGDNKRILVANIDLLSPETK